MALLRATVTSAASENVWTARRDIRADPEDVLRALTDPDAIAEWAPVCFEVAGLAGGPLQAGSRERVSGSLAGIGTTFELDVRRADTERLELLARGPVTFDVAYRFVPRDDGVLIVATVGLRRERGITAQVLRAAVTALLNAGALASSLRRLEAVVRRRVGAALAAA